MDFIDKFTVFWKDERIAAIDIDQNKNVVVQKYCDVFGKQPFWGGAINFARVCEFVESRCFDESRADKRELLEAFGLSEYNPWKIVKITHGRMWDDFMWLKFPGENITWKDVSHGRV